MRPISERGNCHPRFCVAAREIDQLRQFRVRRLFYLLNCRSLTRSMFSVGWFSNPWLLAGLPTMLAAFTYAPLMNAAFRTAPIHAEDWLRIAAVGAAAHGVVALEGWLHAAKARY
jgi:cation-transporting P-type ATPase F